MPFKGIAPIISLSQLNCHRHLQSGIVELETSIVSVRVRAEILQVGSSSQDTQEGNCTGWRLP